MRGIENRGLVVAGVGAGSLDYFLPIPDDPTDVWPGFREGGKGRLDPDRATLLENTPDLETHVGGNAPNSLGWMALQLSVEEARMLGGVGVGDVASEAIVAHLAQMGISLEFLLKTEGDLPSIAAIQHHMKGGNRMVFSRDRQLSPIPDELLERGLRDADIVFMASLKDVGLMGRVVDLSSPKAFMSLNPSQTEIDNKESRAAIVDVVRSGRLDLLAVNETEGPQLMSRQLPDDRRGRLRLALENAKDMTNQGVETVLSTLGEAGIAMASNGDVIVHEIVPVPKEEIGTTLGAGDRAHAVAALRLKEGAKPEDILEEIAYSTAELVRTNGAHQDLYQKSA